jgi:dynein heavy chain, axonemal
MPDNPALARLQSVAALVKSNNNLMASQQQGGDKQSMEKKRATLDARHRHLLDRFATFADVKLQDLENLFLVGGKVDLVNEFFKEGGTRKVFFFWQPSKVFPIFV